MAAEASAQHAVPAVVADVRAPAQRQRACAPIATALLASAALLPAVWKVIVVPLPGVSLTIGRLLILLTAAVLAAECVRARDRLTRPTTPALALIAGVAVCFVWITISAATQGCRCSDEAGGFAEVAALTVLAVAVATVEPRARPWLLLAAALGAAITAGLALTGVGPLTAGARVTGIGGGRLAGPLGNPNYLAFAVSVPLPTLIVYQAMLRGARRLGVLAITAGILVATVLTYSRAAFIGTAAGVLALAAVSAKSRRGRLLTLSVAAAMVLIASVGYGTLLQLRSEPPPADRALSAVDLSRWDARAGQGLIPRGPARLSDAPSGALRVDAGPLEGASFPWGIAGSDRDYELTFELRGSARVGYAMQDNLIGAGARTALGNATGSWRAHQLRWRPTARSANARAYFWATVPGEFELRRIAITDLRTGVVTPVPTRLRGSAATALKRRAIANEESLDVGSRKAGIRLAFRAFASSPVTGIGWGDFPAYADARARYGKLPTHDEYLRVLAELGIVGVVLFGIVFAAVATGLVRGRRDAAGLATLGVLVSGGVQLLFINGLVASQIAASLAFAAAVCCARAGRQDDETSRLWPDSQLSRDGVLWPVAAR